MQLLESVMAFAVAMIIFSTITTGIVELLLRLSGTREKNLEKTIRALFETVIWPRMKQRLVAGLEGLGKDHAGKEGESGEGAGKSESERPELARASEVEEKTLLGNQFVNAMMGNPLSNVGKVAGDVPSIPARKESQIDALSILAFAERLGRSDVGKAILAEGEVQIDPLVKDFVRTFDRFARASQEVFRKKAQQTAMVVGVIFALAANVEAGRLFMTLMEEPNLRNSIIAEAEGAVAANKAVMQRLEELQAELEENDQLTTEQSAEIKTNIKEVAANIEALDPTGLPIGYAYFPYCNTGEKGDPNCADAKDSGAGFLKALRWLILTVVAGILIGLGGPFWFKVFSSLSQVAQLLRSLGAGRSAKPAQPDTQTETAPKPEDSAKPKSVLEAFTVAAQVHAQSEGTP